jgi:hypothetical protein
VDGEVRQCSADNDSTKKHAISYLTGRVSLIINKLDRRKFPPCIPIFYQLI